MHYHMLNGLEAVSKFIAHLPEDAGEDAIQRASDYQVVFGVDFSFTADYLNARTLYATMSLNTPNKLTSGISTSSGLPIGVTDDGVYVMLMSVAQVTPSNSTDPAAVATAIEKMFGELDTRLGVTSRKELRMRAQLMGAASNREANCMADAQSDS